jgi:hypothetical protein
MRIEGTKYEEIDALPPTAQPVSKYASTHKMQVGHVYMKYNRFAVGYANGNKGADPGYVIRCFQGMNFVIPR